jgi:hypothetical protein
MERESYTMLCVKIGLSGKLAAEAEIYSQFLSYPRAGEA